MRLAIRCARDSIPPLRLEIMVDLIVHPGMMTADDVRGRIKKPRTTVWRELEALHMLGIVTCEEEEIETESFYGGVPKTKRTWSYSLSPSFDRDTLYVMEPAAKEAAEAAAVEAAAKAKPTANGGAARPVL